MIASCPKVGSSRTSTRGRAARAVPTDSRRFSPPERVKGLASATRSRRSRSSRSSARAPGSSAPLSRAPSSSSSATVALTNWCSGSWNTVPMRRISSGEDQHIGSQDTPESPRSPPAATTSPAAGHCRPARVRARVDFPAPLGPTTARCCPARSVRSMPREATGAVRAHGSRSAAAAGGASVDDAAARRRARAQRRCGWVRVTARSRAASSLSPPAGVSASPESRPVLPASAVPASSVPGTAGLDPPPATPSASPGPTGTCPGTHTPASISSRRAAPRTFSGAPSWLMPPAGRSTITRSTCGAHTPTRCSTTTSVEPYSRTARSTASRTSSTPAGSRLAVGSSSSSSPGRIARIPASPRRCFCPPDSADVGRSQSRSRPTAARASSQRGRISSRGTPRFSGPKARS